MHWTFSTFGVTRNRWLPPFGDEFLGRLWLFAPGKLSSWYLFQKAHWANDKMLWIVRGLTFALLIGGWTLAFDPMTRMFGNGLVRGLTAFAFGFVVLFLATSCWTIFTALAYITARPLRSILVLSCIAGMYVHLNRLPS
jgi:hypothetical protein